MRISPCKTALMTAVLTFACNTPSFAHKVIEHLPRFNQVTPTLFRGGQPTTQGFEQLKERGVRTVINLRDVDDNAEVNDVKRLGMNYVNIPLDGLSKPTDAEVQKFLAITQDPRFQPVYVHCKYGRDRTGCMIGIYRSIAERWSPNDAYKEMVSNGFRPAFPWLSDAVYDRSDKVTGVVAKRPLSIRLFNSLGVLGFSKSEAPSNN